jgi:MFS family permease
MIRRLPFVGYLTAQAVSITGTRVSMIAIPWFVLTTTGSATRMGIVAFAEMAPLVILQALAGPLMDRWGARRVAIGCDLVSVLAVGTVPVAHAAGVLSFPLLIALVVLSGSLRGPGDAAKHAMLPVLIDQVGLPTERATGVTGAVERGASMAGAALAGGLVALVGPTNALVVDAASFLISGVVLVLTTKAATTHRAEQSTVRTSYVAELRSGWDFMRRDPILMGIGVMVAVTNLLDAAWSAVLVPVWARDGGHGVQAVGLLGATFGGAAILGSVVAAAYGHRLSRYVVYLAGFLLAGVPRYVALALDWPWLVILIVAVVGGFASGFLNPLLGAVLFERIPAELMGRVSSLNIAMSWSLIPFGGLLGGALVTGFGIAPALLFVGGAYFVTTMVPAVQPRWRELDDRRPVVPASRPVEASQTATKKTPRRSVGAAVETPVASAHARAE